MTLSDSIAERFASQNYASLEASGRKFRFTGFPDDASDPNNGHSAAQREALAVLDEFREKRKRLAQDDRFTEAGVREKLVEEARRRTGESEEGEGDERLSTLDSYVNRLQGRVERKRSKLEGPPSAEDAAQVARDSEMRDHLKSMEAPERRQFLNRAVAEGREDVVRAALDGAPELSGLTADHQEQLREQVARERNPDLVQEIEADRKALESLKRTRETVQEAVFALATEPIPTADEAA